MAGISREFGVDFQAIVKDPNKVVDTVKDLGKQLKGKNAGEIVDSLLGKKGEGGAAKSCSISC